MEEIGILEFYKLIHNEKEGSRETGSSREMLPKLQKVTNEPPEQEQETKVEQASGTFKAFADVLESSLDGLEKNGLTIHQCGDNAPINNPSATKARPDVVIILRDNLDTLIKGKIPWVFIEMVIEFHSTGKTTKQREKQVVTYVAYLLEARPDLVSALGLLVEPDSLNFFCNVGGIKKLSLSRKEDYLPLLSAVMEYLNGGQKKNVDPTLSRKKGEVFFDISVPCAPTPISPCHLHYSHDPFGRRTSVFICKPETGVTAIRAIKDQYIRKERSCIEKDILDKIHAEGTYPAVVRMCFYDRITQATCGDRIKVRIALKDYGTDFLSLKTPRDAIYALYDLLEVTRGLYLDRGILHRDISPYNIMIRDSRDTQDIDTCSSTSPVFIQHLLNPKVPKHKSSIFLIDFGYGQDLSSSRPPREGRTGTPMFIARAVQAGKPLPENPYMIFPELPPLSEGIRAIYESEYSKRIELFKEQLGVQIGPSQNPPSSPFRHKLAHDGESGTWSFLWWGIQAFPKNAAQVPINATSWAALMPQYYGSCPTGLPDVDSRNAVLHQFIDREGILHPGYGDLFDLFRRIAVAILPDYHWAEPGVRQSPDFAHENLQRIILNFVDKNKNASFMDKEKADQNRTVIGVTSTPHLSTGKIALRRFSEILTPAFGQGHKRKLNETAADPVALIDALTANRAVGESSTGHGDSHDNGDDEDTHRPAKKPRIGGAPVIDPGTE